MRTRTFTLFWAAVVALAPSPAHADLTPANLTPAGIYRLALVDLETVQPERRIYTRYAAMNGVNPADRDLFSKAFTYVINATSLKSRFHRPTVVSNTLLRIDIEALGWDRYERQRQIDNLAKIGIRFPDANKFNFVDVFESLGEQDPFYQVTRYSRDGRHAVRGWINPEDAEKARVIAHTNYLVVSAPRALTVLMQEKDNKGLYSTFLLLPSTEDDLFKRFTDIKTVDRERLRHGGAKIRSDYVALHSRELQELPSLIGWDARYIHRTFDFLDDSKAESNPFETFAGRVNKDGSEILGSLNNGLIWAFLSDGNGKQAFIVPQQIALDLRPSKGVAFDRSVVTPISCLRCHGAEGILAYKDELKPLIVDLKQAGKLVVKSKDPHFVAEETATIEEYYEVDAGLGQPSGLETRIALQQASYAARVKACNGLESAASAEAVTRFFDEYHFAPVSPEQAAKEIGHSLEEARILWLAASDPKTAYLRVNEYNSLLANLRQGASIRRAQWERVLGDSLRSQVYSWELSNPEALKGLKAKAQ